MRVLLSTRVMHDGQAYAPGDVIDIAKDQAEALLACGAAQMAGRKKADPSGAQAEAQANAQAEQPQD